MNFRTLVEKRTDADLLSETIGFATRWPKLHSTNPNERLNREIKRRAEVLRIFPNENAIVRRVGAIRSSKTTSGPFGAHAT